MFSGLRLWTSIECAYCVAIMLICWHVVFYFYEREFKYCFQVFFIDGMCVVALALVTNTMSRATSIPL